MEPFGLSPIMMVLFAHDKAPSVNEIRSCAKKWGLSNVRSREVKVVHFGNMTRIEFMKNMHNPALTIIFGTPGDDLASIFDGKITQFR